MMSIIINLCIILFSVQICSFFDLDDSTCSAHFAVNSTTGEVVLADNDLFAMSFSDCTFTVLVEDNGVPALNDT